MKATRRVREFALRCVRGVDPRYRIRWARTKGPYYTWNGKGLLRMSEGQAIRAVHDVAHVMISPKSRRKLPEFGLGPDPSNNSYPDAMEPERVISFNDAQDEEYEACDLHWALAAYLWGSKGAIETEEYLFMTGGPRLSCIRRMRKHKGLPEDFVSKVLAVFEQREKSGWS